MSSKETKALVRFLMGASRTSLGEFYLARLNHTANLERDLRESVRRYAQELAWVYLANLLREHGEEIVSELGPQQRPGALGG